MVDVYAIIGKFYEHGSDLERVLVGQSRQVTDMAIAICERLKSRGEAVDVQFVREAAMLHDIGIVRTDARGIYCVGTEPYICHGMIGRQMLEELGLFRHALVCERHTGAGLSREEIERAGFPLPHRDMLPISIEERIICYADKFFSKTHVGEPPKPLERVRQKMLSYGEGSLARFDAMHAEFSLS